MKKNVLLLFAAMLFVNSVYAVITGIVGVPTVCAGSTRTLSNATVGGTWSSSNTATATVSASGVVTGIAAGTAMITYNVSGAIVALAVTVNATPPATTGSTTVCGLETTALSNAMPGGMWSSARPAVGSVSTSGVVRANSPIPDTVSIFYTMPGTGCRRSTLITINDHPYLLCFGSFCASSTLLCVGSSAGFAVATATGSVAGMLWSSSNPSVASVSLDGSVYAVSPGMAYISLTTPQGCSVSAGILVPAPTPAITGTLSACHGKTTTLSNAMPGGTWSTSCINATISTAGVVMGNAPGTAIIGYTPPTGCVTQTTVTILEAPYNITGTLVACPGTSTTLGNLISGGTWSSGNTGIATIGASTGIVTGVAPGTVSITYTSSAGCRQMATVTVNTNPNITGTKSMCPGKTTFLTSVPAAATWASSNTTMATIATGIVTGVAAGTAIITATATTGCKGTAIVTVNAVPPNMTGVQTVCAGSTTSLSNVMTGGTWASSSVAMAAVSSTGVVTGTIAGTTNISYTSSSGCLRTAVVTVNAVPSITGIASVCVGTKATLSGLAGGGTWSSISSATATVGSTGIVTGVTSGTATIDYTLSNGCKKTAVATVNITPGTISGTASLCSGTGTTLSNSLPGGVWSSGNVAVASIGTAGNLIGATAGTSLISYTYGTCRATRAVTVLAVPAAIMGVAKACTGMTATLTNTTAGGAWSSSNAGIGAVSATGVVTGGAAGTANIIYTLPNTCSKSVVATVNANPASITGTRSLCPATTTTLANATTGMLSWSSSNMLTASVTSAGVVSGIAAGTTKITYKLTSGCYTTAEVTVNPIPLIVGTLTACPGTTTTLGNCGYVTSIGTFASTNTSRATIDAYSGVVSGISAGTVAMIYTTNVGCSKSTIVTINATPVIGGTLSICPGKTTMLTSSPAGTVWTSGNTAVATASAGVVTGVAAGTSKITVTAVNGCKGTANILVNPQPPTISGILATCVGSTTSLSNTMTGGAWTSSLPGVASITSGGVVTGVLQGNATISYTSTAGCLRTGILSVNALPTITGTASICVGTVATLAGAATGGSWVSSVVSKATVGATGIVTGVSAGTTTISYTLANGCRRTTVATVNTTPAAITGTASLCSGSATTLSNSLPGGAWSSGSVAIASVGTAGNITGTTAGTALISYTFGTCRATRAVTVLASPAVIGGIAKACPGTTATLTNTSAGGAWSSGNAAIGTVSTTGVLTGSAAGTANIIYTLPNTCSRSVVATINANPASITGTRSVCTGATTSLTSATTGALSWTSSDLSKASVNTLGVVSGMAGGTSNITYKLTTGCLTIAMVTVNAMPAAITGTLTACSGLTTTLANVSTGGAWSSGNTSVASINVSGVVTGVAGGTSVVSYSFPTGCRKTTTVTINQSPMSIAGTATVCKNATTSLSNTGTGTWSTLAPTIATVSSTTGLVTGVNAGTGTVVFTAPNGCKATKVVTVNICGSREMTTAVATTEFDTHAVIFPNPTSGMFTINSPEAGTLSVLAVNGKVVANYNIDKGNTNIVLPQELAVGVYVCRFNGADGAAATIRLIYQP
jgi:uncharacterized protein YjdB